MNDVVAKPPPAARPKAGEPGWLQSLAKSLERGSQGDGVSGDTGVSRGEGSSYRETSQERSGEKSSSQKSSSQKSGSQKSGSTKSSSQASRGRSEEVQERSGGQTETVELCQSQGSVASSMELLASQAVSSQLLAMEQGVAVSQGAKEGGVELPGTQDLFTQEDSQAAGSSCQEKMSARADQNEEAGQAGEEEVMELPVTQDLFTQEAEDQCLGRNGGKEQQSKSPLVHFLGSFGGLSLLPVISLARLVISSNDDSESS